MPVVPNALERLAFLRLNRGPAPMLDLVGAGGFRAVVLAVDLGLFDALADGPQSVAELAATLDTAEGGLVPLLRFLDALGYLERETSGGWLARLRPKRGSIDGVDRYANTAMTTRWLTDAHGTNMAPWLTAWNDVVFPYWTEHLTTAVREGGPPVDLYEWAGEDPERERVLQAGFAATARLSMADALDAVDVPAGATRLLDVGGGHGLYSAALVRAHDGLTATVFDLPAAEAAFAETVAAEGVGDRVSFVGGDYFVDDPGSDYDVALLFNVVHAHSPAENRRLLERVADALRPGGRIVVMDQFDGSLGTPALRAALGFVGLTYLVTLGADIYSADAVSEWLRDAGFEDVSVDTELSGIGFVSATRR